ncbi:MAG: hydrolase [Oscillospiraceae bacterium]|nr:hydrolase [Oscillospiraceae bacterium]
MKRLIAVAAVPALSVLAISLSPHPSNADAHALYVVSDESYLRVDEVAGDVFLTDGSASLVSRQGGSELALASGRTVTVTHQDLTFSTVSRQETVTELLARLDVRPSPLEMVSVAILDNGIEIIVNSEFVFYEHITNTTEHETVYQYNDKLPDWQENVLQEGRDGERREVYEVIYQDGEETARQLIDVVDTPAEPTIIEKGTRANFANNGDEVSAINTNADGSGTITLDNGQTLTFSSSRTMKGTAYTTGGKVGTRTASGTQVRVGVVAVDRSVMPLGTKVYVVSNDGSYVYGFAVAEDTGVRGNIIDLYMDTYNECIQFGVRDCTVYILD